MASMIIHARTRGQQPTTMAGGFSTKIREPPRPDLFRGAKPGGQSIGAAALCNANSRAYSTESLLRVVNTADRAA